MKQAIKQSTMSLILNIISIIFLGGVAVSFFFNTYYNNKINQANEDRYYLTYYANQFMNGSSTLTSEVRAYAATADQTHYNNYWYEVNTAKNRDIGVEKMREIGITSEEETMISQMSSLSNELVPLEENAMETAARDPEAAMDYVFGTEYSNTIAQINQLKSDFLSRLDSRSTAEVMRLNTLCIVTSILVFVFLVGLVVAMTIQSRMIRRKLIHPIIQIDKEMREIAQGNLSSNFDLEPDTSEIGMLIYSIHSTKAELKKYIDDISWMLSQMAQGNMNLEPKIRYIGDFESIQASLETILNSLNHTISRIDISSAQVFAHADQVSSGAQSLAQGATEQASTISELSSTISDLTERMNDIAENAKKAQDVSLEAAGNLNIGNQKMQDMHQAMEEISNSSQEIGKIIKTIEDIAFQTNILALNAAVEAARAGAAGKGFAVVADEVRQLANKSQEASHQTTLLIETSTRAVQEGVTLAQDTVQTLNVVVEGARQSVEFVEAIALDSDQQAQALRQANIGVDQIAEVIQTNSATAEQSAAASEELSAQAGQLKELVNAFQLRPRQPEYSKTR